MAHLARINSRLSWLKVISFRIGPNWLDPHNSQVTCKTFFSLLGFFTLETESSVFTLSVFHYLFLVSTLSSALSRLSFSIFPSRLCLLRLSSSRLSSWPSSISNSLTRSRLWLISRSRLSSLIFSVASLMLSSFRFVTFEDYSCLLYGVQIWT